MRISDEIVTLYKKTNTVRSAKIRLGVDSNNKTFTFQQSPVDYTALKTQLATVKNPSRRDTVMIEKGFTYILAIQASNPGVWVSLPLTTLPFSNRPI